MREHASEVVVPRDHPCLAGHFPGNPIVPAVMLLELATRALGEALGRAVHLTQVPGAKFLRPLLPGQSLAIRLSIDEAQRSVRFMLSSQGAEVAQGRLEYADAA